jgi:hypothetical protein
LSSIQRGAAGHFVPIGSNGFYEQGGERDRFDQQSVEAQAMVAACLEVYRLTVTNVGAKKRAVLLNGSSGATI